MSFAERMKSTLVYKMPDVEEPIDVAWHRPLAAIVAALLVPTPVQPNHVTWSSLAVGWTANIFLYFAAFGELGDDAGLAYIAAGVLLFGSVILDCADGQLARAKGGGTRMGRLLDGIVDAMVLTPFYGMIVFDIGARFGQLAFWISAFAGIFSWAQILAYDGIKSRYMANALPEPPRADGAETMDEVLEEFDEIKANGSIPEIVLFWIYVNLEKRFAKLFAAGSEQEIKPHNTPGEIESFRARHKGSMRIIANVGLGSHMIFIYSATIAMAAIPEATYAIQFVFVGLFGVLMAVGVYRSRAMKPLYEDEA